MALTLFASTQAWANRGAAASDLLTIAQTPKATQAPEPATAECPKVSIKVFPLEASRHYGLSTSQLAEIWQAERAMGVTASRYVNLGMVQANWQVKATVHVDAQGCAVHEVTAGYLPAKLYVASELAHNRCAFNHVLAHEEHHLHLYRTGLAKLAADAKGPLLEEARDTIRGVGNRDEANLKLADLLKSRFDDIQRMQEEFDSAEEYARNKTTCGGAIPRIFGGAW